MTALSFVKMSGAGNDFVIFDARKNPLHFSTQQIAKICNRKIIGCDQLIILKNFHPHPNLLPQEESELFADCLMEIYNADGSTSATCGNATRCVASILMNEKNLNEVKIKTAAAILKCWRNGDLISVDMGIPNFDWQKIPLAEKKDPQKISLFGFDFSCVNVGNPHAVTFITKPLTDEKFFEIAPKISFHKIFPKQANVEFAEILSDDLIAVRVFERGAGETLACGSGACAVGILAIKNNLTKSKKITTRFKGGDLQIEWNGEGSSVIMTGGYEKHFDGAIDADFFK